MKESEKVAILVKCDLQSGNKEKIKQLIPGLLKNEKYEVLQGIKNAEIETGIKVFES